MDQKDSVITLYSAQTETVLNSLRREGACFSRREYVAAKYGESAPLFLTVYDWFTKELARRLPRPAEAQYPYWAFERRYSVECSGLRQVLTLAVPKNEAVFFDVYDWNKILQLRYLAETPEEEAAFSQALRERGIHRPQEIMLTNFYPELKEEILASWQRLFRHDSAIRAGQAPIESVQAGLWQLKKEWRLP